MDAAERMGVPFQRMNTLVKGRRGVTADTALRLSALTGMDAGFWMGLQADFDLWHALAGRGPVADQTDRERLHEARRPPIVSLDEMRALRGECASCYVAVVVR